MRKYIFIVISLVALGVAYWLISPLFISKEVSENLADITPIAPETLVQGSFEGLANHNAEGTASLLKVDEKYYVHFGDNFKITNGPDLFVHFGKDGQYDNEARLAALKGNVGSQNYEVPAGINPNDYNEVWVWCRAFAVPFGKAVLQ